MNFPNPFELFNKQALDKKKIIEGNQGNDTTHDTVDFNALADNYGENIDTEEMKKDFSNYIQDVSGNLSGPIQKLKKDVGSKLSKFREDLESYDYNLGIIIVAIILVLFWNSIFYAITFNDFLKSDDAVNSNGELFAEKNIEDTKNPFWLFSHGLKLFIYLFVGVYLITILFSHLVFRKLKNNELNIFILSLTIYCIVVGVTLGLLLIPSVVELFENTIGYNIVMSITNDVKDLFSNFKSRVFPNFGLDMSFLFTLFQISNFEESYKKFIVETTKTNKQTENAGVFYDIIYGEIDVDELDENIVENEDINYDDEYNKVVNKFPKIDTEIKNKLFNLVSKKFLLGHFTWTFFGTIITMFATLNSILYS